jgi:hypothetical protein
MRLSLSTPFDRDLLISLRRQYAQLITSGAQLLLLAVGLHLHTITAWLWSLGIMALISLFAWFSALHRLRTINGTPTSKIASAAQGYVELIGKGNYFEGMQIISPISPLPCLWYRYKIERKNGKNEWHTESSGESDAPFLIDDGSAACVIDPTGAEIITSNKDTWIKGEYRYTEWKLLNIDRIYAIGEFKTIGGSTDSRRHSDEIKAVLAEWKLNMPELHSRFDLDKDGILDMKEWGLARSAAKREAEKRLIQASSAPDTHYLLRPNNGRLFLISNIAPDKLARRYAIWTWANLLIFFLALGAMAWIWQ